MSMTAKPNVVIADNHQLVAAGLGELLTPHCDVRAIVADATALLNEVRTNPPDLVVHDVVMPPSDGIDVIRQIRALAPATKIIVVTTHDEAGLAADALRAGAHAYVLKKGAASELHEAVRRVLAQQTYVTPLLAADMIGALTTRRTYGPPITPRQREVLRLLAEGKSMKEAAAVLNLTVRTVAFHKYRMMEQQHIKSSAELVRFAVGQHIV
jgi:DNA-binding NarL/FixJ family response regulator